MYIIYSKPKFGTTNVPGLVVEFWHRDVAPPTRLLPLALVA